MPPRKTKKSELEVAEPKNPLRVQLRRLDGTPTGESVDLSPAVFGLDRNDHVLYLAVKAELTNRRHGTHATKTRAFVSGGGRKPAKQKGRGAARIGSIRSPVARGGGTMHGPHPHDYELKVPTKVRRLARRIAFSVKAQASAIDLIEDFNFEAPKTKSIAGILKAFGATGKSALILVDGVKPHLVKSCLNIPRLEIREALNASAYDVLRAQKLIISRSALRGLEGGLGDA